MPEIPCALAEGKSNGIFWWEIEFFSWGGFGKANGGMKI